MAYDKATDLAQIQADVLGTNVANNPKITGLNKLKTSTKIALRAINEVNEKLINALAKTDQATDMAKNATQNVDFLKEDVKTIITEIAKEFMETRFPVLTNMEPVWDSGCYNHTQDEKNRTVVNMDKGVAIVKSKLPLLAKASYKNQDSDNLMLVWDNAIALYNPNKSGEQLLKAVVPHGIYNPQNLEVEIVFNIARSEKLSLSNWWGNGAKLGDKNLKDGKTAEDFAVLEDYYITAIDSAFKNADIIISLPEIVTENDGVLKSMAYTFSGCRNLEAVPVIPSSSVTNFYEAFRDCEKITDLSHIDMNKATSVTGAFAGCTKLAKLPNMKDWHKCAPTNFENMFRGCSSLPAVLAPIINMSKVSSLKAVNGMFSGSSVKEITVKYTEANIPDYFYPMYLGGMIEKITIVDADLNVREVRTVSDQPKMVKFLTGGTTKISVPAGVSSAKVALVSGVSYSYSTSGIEHIAAKNNPSAIKRGADEIITSKKDAGSRDHYFDWTGSQEQHGGIPAEFDATYEDYSKQIYCCGVGGGKQFTKYCHAWAALDNTFVQDTINVTPGEELTVEVGSGNASGACTFNKKPSNGVYNGYVLVEFQ